MPKFSTKKTARAAGFLTMDQLWRKRRVPIRSARSIVVKREKLYDLEKCEELISRTEAHRRGLTIPKGIRAVTQLFFRSQICPQRYDAFRVSDCIPRKVRQLPPSQLVDILLATFTVNKAAKRQRDAAKTFYAHRIHGFAAIAKTRKNAMYELKDRGIIAAYQSGRLRYLGQHGGYSIYRGEGYCFHSLLIPPNAPTENESAESKIFIEATPKGSGEARLRDAVHTLECLKVCDDGFSRRRLTAPTTRTRNDCCWELTDLEDDEPEYSDYASSIHEFSDQP